MTSDERLLQAIKFMLGCFIADKWHVKHPATWGHIIRELRRAGLEVRL